MTDNDREQNDLECLRINYDVEGWKKISEREGNHCVVPLGAVYAIRYLIEEVEILRSLSLHLVRVWCVDDQDWEPEKKANDIFAGMYAKQAAEIGRVNADE